MENLKLLITSHSFGSCGKEVFIELENAGIMYNLIKSNTILKEKDLIDIIVDYDAIIVGADIISEEVIDAAKNLKIIAKHGVGLDNIDLEAAKKNNIKVTVAKDSNSLAVAELAVSMMTALARNITQSTNDIKKGIWDRKKGTELSGSTLGVVGTGAIGKKVIELLYGYHMNILAYDLYPDNEFVNKYNGKYVGLDDLCRESDFITLHLPLIKDTEDLIDERRFSLMKDGVFLVNAARGGLVDEAALYKFLQSGKLAGAAIDTFSEEPPDKDNPLLKLRNLICTPHIGAYTYDAINKMSRYSAKSVIEFKNQFYK